MYQNYQYCWFSHSPRYGHGSYFQTARFIFFDGTLGIFILGVVFEITIEIRKHQQTYIRIINTVDSVVPHDTDMVHISELHGSFFEGTLGIFILGVVFEITIEIWKTPATIHQNYQYCWFSRSPRYGHGSHLRTARLIFRGDTRDIYVGCCFWNNNWNKENTSKYISELSILLIQSFPKIRTWFIFSNCTVHCFRGDTRDIYVGCCFWNTN